MYYVNRVSISNCKLAKTISCNKLMRLKNWDIFRLCPPPLLHTHAVRSPHPPSVTERIPFQSKSLCKKMARGSGGGGGGCK